jgi:hypothetical protein
MVKLRYVLSVLRAVLSHAPRGSLCLQVSNWTPLFSVQHWANRFPLMYAILRDPRNVGYRIAEMHDKGLVYNGLDLKIPGGESPVPSGEHQRRSEGIHNLCKARPASSLLDSLIFLEDFSAGARYQACNSGNSKHAEASRNYILDSKV